jgi:hypothetical protein
VIAGFDAYFVDEGLQWGLALAVGGLVQGGSKFVAGVARYAAAR